MLNIKSLALFFLLTGVGAIAFGQGRQVGSVKTVTAKSTFTPNGGTFVPQWGDDIQVNSFEDLNRIYTAPYFKGAALDNQVPNLPVNEIKIPVDRDEELIVTSVTPNNVKEESSSLFRFSLPEAKMNLESDWYPASPVVVGERVMERGRTYQVLRIYPIQVSHSGSVIRTAESVSYRITRRQSAAKQIVGMDGQPLGRTYAANSVLNSGEWFKLGFTASGIYKLDYSYLSSIGVDVNNLDPRTLRIHGNGGGMLPQTAGEAQYDDLEECAIFVSGQADGSFDNGDYVLFYAEGPHNWYFHDGFDRYVHRFNIYSDTSFYFLSFGNGNGKRIANGATSDPANFTPTDTRRYSFHETDNFNALSSGRVWLGENFDFTTNRTFSFGTPNLVTGSNITVTTRVAARSNLGGIFTLKENGNTLTSISVPNINTQIYGSYYYRANYQTFNVSASQINDGSLDLEYDFNKPTTNAVGYLDYIEMEYRSRLNVGGANSWRFTATDSVGSGKVFAYSIAGANSSYRIWNVTDVTNVTEMNYNSSSGNLNFNVRADSVLTFYAFLESGARAPASAIRLGNQNLHGLSAADYLIITHPNFEKSANTLATFHRNELNQTVHVVNVKQIFNEFSCGAQDPAGIRDFIKMFWDRYQGTANAPRYVLMMGDGSYDYKKRITADESNFIPTYQSRKSQRPTESYTSDDFYGFLDDGEGFWGEKAGLEGGAVDILYYAEGDTVTTTHNLDIAIGRFPVNTEEEADAVVAKVMNYHSNPASFGPWRNRILLVADHKDSDGIIHISQSNSFTGYIEAANHCMNVDKVFMDNYNMVNTASGARFPDGKEALLRNLDEGSLLVNYTGHGGEIGWSNASILDISDINNIDNENRLPAYVTATCEFGRWDDPTRVSGAETVFLKEDGGSIAMFTTVRVVYSGPNYVLNQNFYEYAFDFDSVENRYLTMGEIFMRTKNDSWLGGINNRNFTLMGDPALQLAYPKHDIVITNINGASATDTIVDSLGALTLVTVEGQVQDQLGNFISNYNGDLSITVFDKPTKFTTKRAPYTFLWQKNKVFNGSGTVQNGQFSFQFVVPIDISYENGLGKISLYAENGQVDASGCNVNIYVGGSGSGAITDDLGPELDVYMNDEHWAEGGMVDPNPLMIASIYDENGLNTVGTGIGHELTAILDDKEDGVIILNDYYAAEKNSYQRGEIRYPFEELAVGEHSLDVKVWDVANNSSSKRITFVVADDAEMALGHVLNYPNPFTTNTKFMIEHNLNGRLLDVQVKIYTVGGTMVKSMEDTFLAEGNLYCDMEWDGLDEYGDVLGRGVYVYQVSITDNETGERVNRFEKLVLLR